jgi:hypothetical protein
VKELPGWYTTAVDMALLHIEDHPDLTSRREVRTTMRGLSSLSNHLSIERFTTTALLQMVYGPNFSFAKWIVW